MTCKVTFSQPIFKLEVLHIDSAYLGIVSAYSHVHFAILIVHIIRCLIHYISGQLYTALFCGRNGPWQRQPGIHYFNFSLYMTTRLTIYPKFIPI